MPSRRAFLGLCKDNWRPSLESLATPRAPSEMSVSIREPQVVLDVAGKKIIFLIDKGATKSVPISHTGPVFPAKAVL